jgi:predicted N-acyltransferase
LQPAECFVIASNVDMTQVFERCIKFEQMLKFYFCISIQIRKLDAGAAKEPKNATGVMESSSLHQIPFPAFAHQVLSGVVYSQS